MPLSRPDPDDDHPDDSRYLDGAAGALGIEESSGEGRALQAGRNNLQQLVQLRWLAAAGQFGTVLSVHHALHIRLPMPEMLTLLAVLVLFNLACWLRTRWVPSVRNAELFAGLLVDIAVLSGQLYYSGGVTNPFIFLFLLQIAVGAVLLPSRYIWFTVAVTGGCFVALTQWHLPLLVPDMEGLSLPTHYIGGLLIG